MEQEQQLSPEDESNKLTNWKKEPTVRDLKQDYTDSLQVHQKQVKKIEAWLDMMNITGSAKIKVPAGNSSVQPRLIKKQAEWRYAALSEPFLSSPKIFDVAPVTWEDRDASKQNDLVLNNQFNTKLDKQKLVDDLVRAAVDEGTVILKTGWVYKDEKYKEQVPEIRLTQDDNLIQFFQQLDELAAADPSQIEDLPIETQTAWDAWKTEGVAYRPEFTGKTIEQEATRVLKNQPTLEVCDFRNVIIDPTCEGDMDKAGFVIHRYESSMSQLKADGRYKNLDKINLVNQSNILAEPDYVNGTTNTGTFNFADEARKKFLVYEYWGSRDIDGSGIVQPIVAAWVGSTLVRLELNPFPDKKIPFETAPYLPVKRSTYGESDGSLLEDNQKIIGAVTRGALDIMAKSANGQTAIAKGVLDVTNRKRFEQGLDFEYNPNFDPDNAIRMMKFAEIPRAVEYILSQQNNDAESMTGVVAFSSGISGAALGDTATGVRGALDAASKRELGILRRLSAVLVKVGRKFISMNAEFLSDEEVIRVTNEKFVKIRRDDLAGEFDLTLTISTAEEDNNKASELGFMLQTIGPNMDIEMTKMILSDIARLKKMPDLAKRIEAYAPQPDPIAEQRAQMELMLLQAQIATEQAKAAHYGAGANLQTVKQGTEQAKAANLMSDKDNKDLNFVEQESGVTQERNLQSQAAQAEAQTKLKLVEHALDMEKERQIPPKKT